MQQHDVADVETIWSRARENVYSDRGLAAASPIISMTTTPASAGAVSAVTAATNRKRFMFGVPCQKQDATNLRFNTPRLSDSEHSRVLTDLHRKGVRLNFPAF